MSGFSSSLLLPLGSWPTLQTVDAVFGNLKQIALWRRPAPIRLFVAANTDLFRAQHTHTYTRRSKPASHWDLSFYLSIRALVEAFVNFFVERKSNTEEEEAGGDDTTTGAWFAFDAAARRVVLWRELRTAAAALSICAWLWASQFFCSPVLLAIASSAAKCSSLFSLCNAQLCASVWLWIRIIAAAAGLWQCGGGWCSSDEPGLWRTIIPGQLLWRPARCNIIDLCQTLWWRRRIWWGFCLRWWTRRSRSRRWRSIWALWSSRDRSKLLEFPKHGWCKRLSRSRRRCSKVLGEVAGRNHFFQSSQGSDLSGRKYFPKLQDWVLQ